jgi:cold shock CspA family protein
MGAIEVTPTLYIDQRQERYTQLLAGNTWHQPSTATEFQPYLESFETYQRQNLALRGPLIEQVRIKTLLALLEWREGGPEWQDRTRYLEIERGLNKENEYKERPVLSDALAVAASSQGVVQSSRAVITSQAEQTNPIRSVQMSENNSYGEIKSLGLGRNRDYGFITPDGDDSESRGLYFNYRYLGSNPQLLKEKARVSYRAVRGPNGDEARNVTVLG